MNRRKNNSKKSSFKYSQQQNTTKYLELQDMATALEYGKLPNNRRVQLKLPNTIVEEIDLAFPHISRSKLFTQLALNALQNKYRYHHPELELMTHEEQNDLDQMWSYLESRDAE